MSHGQPPELLAAALDTLSAAVGRAERALEARLSRRERNADADEELAAMQDDRARLASELDAALEEARALKIAQTEAERRVSAAIAQVGRALAEAQAASDTD